MASFNKSSGKSSVVLIIDLLYALFYHLMHMLSIIVRQKSKGRAIENSAFWIQPLWTKSP